MKPVRWLPALLLTLLLVGCAREESVPETTEPPVEHLTVTASAEEVAALDTEYPDLKEVNFAGSTCYDAIVSYAVSHPGVRVRYTVKLGNRSAMSDTTELTLLPDGFDYDVLKENLRYLTKLERLTFEKTELSPDEFRQLQELYPELDLDYTVAIGDSVYASDTTSLDLSRVESEDVASVASKLALLPNLTEIELMDGETSRLGIDDAVTLQEAAPDAALHYTFTLFGKTVTTTDEEIIYQYQRIGDEGEDELRRALKLLRGTRVVLDSCGFTDEVLAGVREDFRDHAKVVWRVHFGKDGSCLTDREVIRAVYGLNDSNCSQLIYCEDARFLDFGHDEYLTDASFVSTMTKLEAVILSGSMVADLTPFANCESLVFLELAYCGYLEDISPLADCTNLNRLNICYTKVSDLSALDSLQMHTLCAAHAKVDSTEQSRFTELHPDCLTQFTGSEPYGIPWRYTSENGSTVYNEYYAKLREVFDYDHAANTTW